MIFNRKCKDDCYYCYSSILHDSLFKKSYSVLKSCKTDDQRCTAIKFRDLSRKRFIRFTLDNRCNNIENIEKVFNSLLEI